MKLTPDNRLQAVASLVTEGAYLADVGTDHAYLPIYLMEQGRIAGAVASDIGKGPLESAKKNIAENGYTDKIITVLTDGLTGLDTYPITEIAIAGMGGLMIQNIIKQALFVKERKIALILQPMQHIKELRTYLGQEGFTVEKEVQATADRKFYQIIRCVYTGKKESFTPVEALLGRYNMEHKYENTENFITLCNRHLEILRVKIEGLTKGAYDATEEKELYDAIRRERDSAQNEGGSHGNRI